MLTHRRHFLRAALGAGGTFGLGLATARLWNGPEQQPPASSPPTAWGADEPRPALPDEGPEIHQSARAFGTVVSISVRHADQQAGRRAIVSALAELELIEETMSLYRPHSQLCRLNASGFLHHPHPYLLDVLHAAADLARRTDGAFDVTVQPLWAVYARAKDQGRLPPAREIALARSRVDWRNVEVTPQHVRLVCPQMAVTLNGIAQGFATDKALAALRRHGIQHALVDLGEIGALGNKTGDQPWKVGIQHPRDPQAYIALARLGDRALSTSGDYATTFSSDGRANHIFDPRTGYSPDELASVSVAAPTALMADGLSTAVMVLGAQCGLELVRRTPGADALLVLKDGRTLATAGFPVA
jgi:thiamine biosynthesis lipoprotein